ncbi:unnamed protein product [Clonostachys rhizophaga]|uniref:Uncharacterized protein n=1 Tax=Clonostachys rhizophaga TaxID=160324 RepID=A0A9N9VAG6_9HYPO|nr:unnamed protein product [Clonostachys rhizophaga]
MTREEFAKGRDGAAAAGRNKLTYRLWVSRSPSLDQSQRMSDHAAKPQAQSPYGWLAAVLPEPVSSVLSDCLRGSGVHHGADVDQWPMPALIGVVGGAGKRACDQWGEVMDGWKDGTFGWKVEELSLNGLPAFQRVQGNNAITAGSLELHATDAWRWMPAASAETADTAPTDRDRLRGGVISDKGPAILSIGSRLHGLFHMMPQFGGKKKENMRRSFANNGLGSSGRSSKSIWSSNFLIRHQLPGLSACLRLCSREGI